MLGHAWLKCLFVCSQCRCQIALMYSACGRSDDTLLTGLSDFCPPQRLPGVGPIDCHMYAFVLRGGKTYTAGRCQFAAATRHWDVVLCPLNTLGTYLFMLFTVGNEPFPDAEEEEQW
jgi:hypothetical protein